VSRHVAARLLLAGVVVVTLLLGLGTVGQAAYTERRPAAVATMAVLIGLFAVAVVVWAHAEPVSRPPEPDVTAVFGAVGLVWPDGSPAAADAVDVWPGTEWWHTADTEPILFTHEFTSAHDFDAGPTTAEIDCVRGHLGLPQLTTAAHDGGTAASVHVRDLLRREGFDGGLRG